VIGGFAGATAGTAVNHVRASGKAKLEPYPRGQLTGRAVDKKLGQGLGAEPTAICRDGGNDGFSSPTKTFALVLTGTARRAGGRRRGVMGDRLFRPGK